MTYEAMASSLSILETTIYNRIKTLKDLKILERKEGLQSGYWFIHNNDLFKELMKDSNEKNEERKVRKDSTKTFD